MKTKVQIPRRFLLVRKDRGTIAIRDSFGRMKGRRGPRSKIPYNGPGDTTRARHIYKSIDLNGDGKIGPNEHGGVIQGRSVKVKASRRAKGYERRV
jgi:hypothetical protein